MDLYQKIADEEGVDRGTVKSLAMPYMYGEYRQTQMEDLIRQAVKMHKSFLKMEVDGDVIIPELPKGTMKASATPPKRGVTVHKTNWRTNERVSLNEMGVTFDPDTAKELMLKYFEAYPALKDIEKNHIEMAIQLNDGNKSKAARDLGITIKTLYNKLHIYGLFDKYARNTEIKCPVVEAFKARKK